VICGGGEGGKSVSEEVKVKKILFIIAMLSITIAGCGPVTPYPATILQGVQTSTSTLLPSATPTIAFYDIPRSYIPSATPTFAPIGKIAPDLEIISPENIERLGLINRWGKGNLLSFKVSPDHTLVAVATSTGVYLYRSQDLTEVGYLNVNASNYGFMGVGFSPDSKLLAVAGNYVTLWDVVSQQQTGKIPLSHQLVQPWHIEFIPDGRHIVIEDFSRTCGGGGNFALYTVEGYKVFDANECSVNDAQMGAYFLVVDTRWFYFFTNPGFASQAFPDEVVKIDLFKDQIVNVIHNDELRRLYNISPDGKFAAYHIGTKKVEGSSYSITYQTQIINVETGEVKATVDSKNTFESIKKELGEDAWQLTTYGNTDQPSARPCSLDSNAQLIEIPNSQDKLVLPDSPINSLQVIDLSICAVKSELTLPSYGPSFPRYYLDANGDKLAIPSQYSNSVLDVKTGEFTHASIESLPFLLLDLSEKGPGLTGLNADGSKMILSSQEISSGQFYIDYSRFIGYTLRVVDTATGKTLWDLNPSGNRLIKIYPGMDPSTEIIVDEQGLHEWNLDTGKEVRSVQGADGVYCYPSGQECIFVEQNQQIHVLDAKTWKDLYTFDSGQYLIYVQGISPISKKGRIAILYTSGENPRRDMRLVVFDIHSGKKMFELAAEEESGLELIKDQPYFVHNRKDGYIELWSTDQDTPVTTFLGNHTINNYLWPVWTDYSQYYGDVFMSPDTRVFITEENGLDFWDVKTGILLAKIKNTSSLRYSNPLFSPDGRILVTMGSDGTFWVWGVKGK
jgi:WD40 repeat protein